MSHKEKTPAVPGSFFDNLRGLPPRTIWPALLLMVLLAAFFNLKTHPHYIGEPFSKSVPLTRRVLLVPLDSRPPCQKFVIDAARIVGCEIITPPTEILDYYSLPGDTAALMAWTRENIKGCDAAIISAEQLLYGGLLASREASPSPELTAGLSDLLESLYADNPDVPLYVFSILPRLAPPDSIDGAKERKYLMRYARLSDQVSLLAMPGEELTDELARLRSAVSPESLSRYESLFSGSAEVSRALIELSKKGVIERLVIGQDDGERYCLANVIRRELKEQLCRERVGEDKVLITHGADEIALTLLAADEAKRGGFSPRVALAFADESVPWRVMPYMADTMETVALEKIRLLGGSAAASQDDADFTLYMSATDGPTLGSRRRCADDIRKRVLGGERIALVDLSFRFLAEESVLPFLVKNKTPLHALSAYAGWNTASNSIGTAAAHAVLLETALRRAGTRDDALAAYRESLSFLDGRFLEDYFYLKDIIDPVNASLRKAGYTNVNDLDLDHNSIWANAMLNSALKERVASFRETEAFRAPVRVASLEGDAYLRVSRISTWAYYPWPRTFEIYLAPTIATEKITPQEK